MARALVRLKYSPSPAWRQAFQLRVLGVLVTTTRDEVPAQAVSASSALCPGSRDEQDWSLGIAGVSTARPSKGNAGAHKVSSSEGDAGEDGA
eukprot:scaffold14185_cov22-Tisochrysis_lutea.AAC.1